MEDLVMPTASFWQQRRVIVTGHTGFKGGWLTLWLTQLGVQVYGYGFERAARDGGFAPLDDDFAGVSQ
jgi:CDP-glucose 4,6-dehydratase